MGHDHSHGLGHSHGPKVLTAKDLNRSFILGILLNVGYVVVELWYGFLHDSTALVADAVHNIGDISGLLLAFLAFRLLRVKANKKLTFGFKKGTIVASFLNSILLAFAIGAIAWEGVRHILHPQKTSGDVIIVVAFIGIIINFGSALLFRKNKEDDLNVKAAYWHLMADALVSLGVVIGGLAIKYTSWYLLDGVIAVIVAIVILFSTWRLFKDSLLGILDGVPSSIDVDEIEHHLLEIDGVDEIHHLHIWRISTNENSLICHVKVKALKDIPKIKKEIKHELEEHNIIHSTLEFEIQEENCGE